MCGREACTHFLKDKQRQGSVIDILFDESIFEVRETTIEYMYKLCCTSL